MRDWPGVKGSASTAHLPCYLICLENKLSAEEALFYGWPFSKGEAATIRKGCRWLSWDKAARVNPILFKLKERKTNIWEAHINHGQRYCIPWVPADTHTHLGMGREMPQILHWILCLEEALSLQDQCKSGKGGLQSSVFSSVKQHMQPRGEWGVWTRWSVHDI